MLFDKTQGCLEVDFEFAYANSIIYTWKPLVVNDSLHCSVSLGWIEFV